MTYNRADAAKDFMGLTTWCGYFASKSKAKVAKNNLDKKEMKTLNNVVNLYHDFAELQARNKHPMYMQDWLNKLDDFLEISDRELLAHAGKISSKIAQLKADSEYDKFKEYTKH